MNPVFFVSVSDLAICQRCSALFALKIHKKEKSVWTVGIKGSGDFYGSIFHKNIARPFYEAAANIKNPLHLEIAHSISEGKTALEELVRKNIFMPFVYERSRNLNAGQLLAMARAVKIWINAMYNFFVNIPSLMNAPVKNMLTVFKAPEQKIQGFYDFEDGRLAIVGRYDALMFNPDRTEARLIEFKGYKKSDITVPLSQSLIYAWLIERNTGITPSVEIIYLDDYDKAPDVFSPKNVDAMIKAGLPELFYTAFNIISLRKYPKILHDKNLCSICKFSWHCKSDIEKIFVKKKRPGASLVNVLIFFLAVIMITAQVFFFFDNESTSIKESRNLMQVRMRLENLVQEGKNYVYGKNFAASVSQDYMSFKEDIAINSGGTKISNNSDFPKDYWNNSYHMTVNTLNYDLKARDGDFKESEWNSIPAHQKIFSPMGAGYYLVRAYTTLNSGSSIMHQAVIHSNFIISYEEIWY